MALLRTPGIGPAKFKHYLQIDPLLKNLPDIAKHTEQHSQNLIARDLSWSQQKNCHIMLLSDDDYPRLLRMTSSPPPVIFIRGERAALNRLQVAIVGSRMSSRIGEQTAFKFASDLSHLNIVTTSGLALGIDAASHRGALSIENGITIAVLGHGLDMVYPQKHYKLADSIVASGGAVISEFPLGIAPQANNFPRRNRVISGLSLGVVVIEASFKSGSLITADYALEQGREVFAVPGSIYDQNAQGCHKLIRQGAKLVENVAEIVEDLGFVNMKVNFQNTMQHAMMEDLNINKLNLDDVQIKILNSVSYETTATDLIIEICGLSPSMVSAALVNLELSGYITSVPGGYVRCLGH